MRITNARLVGPERIELEERDIEPRPDALLVRNLACGMCHSEKSGWAAGPGTGEGRWLGHEPVGEIVEIGAAVAGGWRVGQRITGYWHGAMATHSVVDPARVAAVPDGLPTEHALGEVLACLVTCARGWMHEAGTDCALVGCGFMGVLSMALVARSARTMIAVDLLDDRLEYALACGATHAVRADDDAAAQVKAITEGRMCGLVGEASGNPAGLRLALKLTGGFRPTVSVISYYNRKVDLPDLADLAHQAVTLRSPHPRYAPDAMDELRLGLLFASRGVWDLERSITHRWPLAQTHEAYASAMGGAPGYIKGLVTMT